MMLSEVYCHAVDLGLLLGAENLKDYPEPWVCKVDSCWTLAINGSGGIKSVDLGEDSMGIEKLETYQMAIWFNGWLAGLITPSGGVICAGEAGNEKNFITALKTRIAAEKAKALIA